MRKILAVLATILLVPAASAQPARKRPAPPSGAPSLTMVRPQLPPPVLMVKRGDRSRPLALTNVKINAFIVGHLAETEMTMTFYNPNARVLEGDLYVPLPQGSTVSGYALDVNGTMVDGVVVGKDKARQVFEIEVRKGVDPGIIEWTKGNNFKTRVFPIPAKGSRTIRVSYVAEVTETRDGGVYYLPLGFRDRVKKLSLRVEVAKAAAKPLVSKGGPSGLRFGRWQDSFVATARLTNAKLTNDLYVTLPKLRTQPVHVETAPDGNVYFSVRDHAFPDLRARAAKAPRHIAVYWDASMSRAKADHKQELALLEAYLRRLRGRVDVHAVVFRNVAARPRRYRLPAQLPALLGMLRAVNYDGGTQLGSARPGRGMGKVDLSLMFTDGISNFGIEDPTSLRGPVYTINVATSANHAFLRYLAMRTGGAYFNLRKTKAAQVANSIGAPVFSFISAEARGAISGSLYPRLRTPVNGAFDLAGKLSGAEATITLKYGYGAKVTHTKTITIKRSAATKGSILRRDWAQKKVADLLVFPDRNEEAIISVGRRHSIVTPGTSLIVLERYGQYLEHQIRPPAGLTKMRARYDAEMQSRVLVQRKRDQSKLAHVIKLWEARKTWWNKRFKYPKNYRVGRKHPKKMRRASVAYGRAGVGSGGGGMGRGAMGASTGRRRRPAAERAPAMKIATTKAKPALARPEPTIAMKPWDPKTPYIAALKAARKSRRYATYLAQRETYGASPAFYLDSANYFRRQKQAALALRILSNLAEMDLENPALLRVLAHRLAQIEKLDLSVRMFDQVRTLRPEEPQSFRDLALVLARRGDAQRKRRRRGWRRAARADYERAMKLLAKVVMQKWARFSEIEVIALTELNNIWPTARKLGVKKPPVDKRLIARLDMDVRIVMTWDADNTDMDLHVVEPSHEEAYYGHNRTRIGGMVSRDFTRGYGPEVYLLRRTMRGKYKIRTKYFGSSAAKLSGAVTLQVDVYTNYGRWNQKRKSITLRLTKNKETFTVGTIGF